MENNSFDQEIESPKGYTFKQMEERVEMGFFCCDPRYDDNGNYIGSCGYDG